VVSRRISVKGKVQEVSLLIQQGKDLPVDLTQLLLKSYRTELTNNLRSRLSQEWVRPTTQRRAL